MTEKQAYRKLHKLLTDAQRLIAIHFTNEMWDRCKLPIHYFRLEDLVADIPLGDDDEEVQE